MILPSSIESYLREAGFSPTEVLVMQRLLQEDALTLRELAAKTGKSTGVLDQAIKKLLGKKILTRDAINGQAKYTLNSLQPILDWMEKDRKRKHEFLERRHQNFESFVATLTLNKHRPEMQHFEGWDGLKKAYALLLEPQQEMLEYDPVLFKAEEDPLRDFKVEYFRERRRRDMFSRILAPDTSLGRRFRSRDPFEFRKSQLIAPEEFPIHFHKIIVNGMVACIDYHHQRAVFIRFPDLATSERAMFEKVWNDTQKASPAPAASPPAASPAVPFATRLFSALREFFLGKASIPMFIIFAIVSAGITFGAYRSMHNANLARLKERVMAIATTGALQFDAQDIAAIHTPEDMAKPEYTRLVTTLNDIRGHNTDIQFAYIMRGTEDIGTMLFVADADATGPDMHMDLNEDGLIDEADEVSLPGDIYTDHEPHIGEGLEKPIVTVGTDKWGRFVSGDAPIRDENGKAVAMLGIDVFASKADELINTSFLALGFLVLWTCLLLVFFVSRNTSLMHEARRLIFEADWTSLETRGYNATYAERDGIIFTRRIFRLPTDLLY